MSSEVCGGVDTVDWRIGEKGSGVLLIVPLNEGAVVLDGDVCTRRKGLTDRVRFVTE